MLTQREGEADHRMAIVMAWRDASPGRGALGVRRLADLLREYPNAGQIRMDTAG
jgi:hypothetical protein